MFGDDENSLTVCFFSDKPTFHNNELVLTYITFTIAVSKFLVLLKPLKTNTDDLLICEVA